MKLIAALLSLIALASADPAFIRPFGPCYPNVCNIAVSMNRLGVPASKVRSSHCASFLRTTVTPAATTVTETVTVTFDDESPTTTPVSSSKVSSAAPVTITPTSIPNYARACLKAKEYATACSCFGVTGTVTTVPTPTVTVTSTLMVFDGKDDDDGDDWDSEEECEL